MPRGRQPLSLDLPRPADLDQRGRRKQDIIYEALGDAIRAGLLTAGQALPATRTLANRWQVSRGLIELVFDQLSQEGYIVRRPGSGSMVSTSLPEQLLHARRGQAEPVPGHRTDGGGIRPKAMPLATHPLPFLARMPDARLFDLRAWSASLAESSLALSAAELGKPPEAGLAALRMQVAEYLRVYRGIACQPDDVIITTSVRDLFDLLVRSVCRPDRAAAIEDPGPRWPRRILGDAGIPIAFAPVDEEGLVVDSLPCHPAPALLHVTPAHQTPLGYRLSARRRSELRAWAARHDAFILEDDHDGECSHDAAPPPALKAQDPDDRIIYAGSFNRILFPNLRVSWCILPAMLRRALAPQLRRESRSASIIEQAALARFMADGHFARHLRIARATYQSRRDLLVESLTEGAGFMPRLTGTQSGVHCVLWLPPGVSEAALCQQAQTLQIHLQGIDALYGRSAQHDPGVLIGYGALDQDTIRRAGQQLGVLLAGGAI